MKKLPIEKFRFASGQDVDRLKFLLAVLDDCIPSYPDDVLHLWACMIRTRLVDD